MASRTRLVLLLSTVGVAAALAYAPVLPAGFRHDDFLWQKVARQWTAGERSLAHGEAGVTPLYNLLYYALYRHWDGQPLPYFATLLLAHVLVSVLCALLVFRLTRSHLAALGGGLFFALMFSHQEAVTWPAAGLHVFAAIPLLAALLLWLEYRAGKAWAAPVSALATALALFTKESTVAVLPLLLALDLLLYPRQRRLALWWHLPPYLLLAVWRVLLPPVREPLAPGGADLSLGLHCLTNLLFVPPQMLIPDLRFENYAQLLQRVLPAAVAGPVVALSPALLLLATLAAVYGVIRGSERVRLGILWCYLGFLTYLPFSYTYARAPRYGYIPSIGVALLVGLLVQWAGRRQRWPRWLTVAALAAYLVVSVGLLQLTAINRHRDSTVRAGLMASIKRDLPSPPPGQVIQLRGLPKQFVDMQDAVPLLYNTPVTCVVSDGPAPPRASVFEAVMDPAGHLQSLKRVRGAPPGAAEST